VKFQIRLLDNVSLPAAGELRPMKIRAIVSSADHTCYLPYVTGNFIHVKKTDDCATAGTLWRLSGKCQKIGAVIRHLFDIRGRSIFLDGLVHQLASVIIRHCSLTQRRRRTNSGKQQEAQASSSVS